MKEDEAQQTLASWRKAELEARYGEVDQLSQWETKYNLSPQMRIHESLKEMGLNQYQVQQTLDFIEAIKEGNS